MSLLVSKTEYRLRLEVCEQCSHLTKLNQCTLCGCFVILKAKIATQKCPQGLWVEATPLSAGT